MSRAVCLVVLLLVPTALASQDQGPTFSVTLPDGTQLQGTADLQGGVVRGVSGPLVGPNDQAARDTRPATGSSRIRGRVIVADTRQPARRASVRLTAPELHGQRMVTTDLDGRFEVANLPAGHYSLNASKNGFIGLAYGQTRPTTPAQTVTLADRQGVDGVDLMLLRGGVITGRVMDEFGDPVSGVSVMTMRAQFQNGQQRLNPFGQRAMTNDIGEYRLFALPAGSYYIAASPPSPTVILNGDPQPSDDRSGFAPIFYPGTADASAAAKVSVAFGQAAPEINFSLFATRLAQISGTAFDSQGRPMATGNVVAMPRGRVQGLQSHGGQLKADGSFIIPNVPPGEYTLRANMRPPPPPPPAPGAPRPAPPRPEVASAAIVVSGDDLSGIRLAPLPPVTVSGRVVFDDPSAAASVRASMVRVMSQVLDAGDANTPLGPPPALKDDFSFEQQVNPGPSLLRANVMMTSQSRPAGAQPQIGAAPGPFWALKSVRVNGVDVTNTGVSFRPGENVTGVEIEMTLRSPEVAGSVVGGGNAPAAGYTVIIFPQDRDLWVLPGPGLTTMTRTDQNGRFTTRNLRPGRFYILAVYEIEQGTWTDPDYLQNAIQRATTFSLADGEKKTIELKGLAN